jgi:hypothetical protein
MPEPEMTFRHFYDSFHDDWKQEGASEASHLALLGKQNLVLTGCDTEGMDQAAVAGTYGQMVERGKEILTSGCLNVWDYNRKFKTKYAMRILGILDTDFLYKGHPDCEDKTKFITEQGPKYGYHVIEFVG